MGSVFNIVIKAFGAAVLLPLIILVFELALGVKFSKALRSALYIGIGLNTLISILNPYFMGLVGKAVSDMITGAGVNLPYVDTGWSLLASLAYSTLIGALIIPIGIIVNLVMIFLHWTDTLDLDLWNFWHWAFVGSLVYYATNNLIYGLLSAIAMEMFLLVIGDATAPTMQKFFNLPGLAWPHASGQGGTLIALPVKWISDRIGLSKIQLNSQTIRNKLGLLGDASVIGFIIAVIIGLIAWGSKLSDLQVWGSLFALGIGTAAYIFMYPKATAALMEGFEPLTSRVTELLSKSGSQRGLNFGMDSALCIGHPDVITTGLLVMLTTVPLMFLLPGNRILILGDIGVTPFFLASAITAIMGGNIITSYIATTISVIVTLYFSSAVSTNFASLLTTIGIALPDTGSAVVGADTRPLHGLFWMLGKWTIGGIPLGLILAFVCIFAMLFFFRRNKKAWYRAFGYEEEQHEARTEVNV